ncbi:MAG: kinase/pyrophosphorylase [Bacteroidetes bacterium]|nr:kinase/pyrophosphorylase [Bacteroidota bacterium]
MEKIFVVSDGTGRTAEQILMAALTQFPNARVEIVMKQEIRKEQQIEEIVKEVDEAKGIIVHTLVSEVLRENLVRTSRIHNIDAIDLMGPLLSRLSHHLANSPSEEPGLFYRLNKEYFKRIDSMQFAFMHDDGQRYYEYEKSEILLVGVSRTFKTPLSIYLAFKGWFVANYPIVLGVTPPEVISQLPLGHVFGLITHPHDLSTLRSVRQEHLGGNTGEYSSIEYVRRELNYSNSIFNQYQWPVVSVTNKPIEEIATEILAIKRRLNYEEFLQKKCH